MPDLNAVITDVVRGDHLTITRTITALDPGDAINRAWLTLKEDEDLSDAEAFLIKEITTADVADQGQITDDGASDGIAAVRFEMPSVATAAAKKGKTYWYDIQVRAASGRIYTPEKGLIGPYIGDITIQVA